MTEDELHEKEFQARCEEANHFFGSLAFGLIEKIITEQEHDKGLSPDGRRKYWLAVEISTGKIVFGKNGWRRVT